MTQSLSQSANPFNTKRIFLLLWPILIEQMLSSLVGLSDTVMVSHVGDTAVSAVGLVDPINVLLINVFSAIAVGTTVIVAQLTGRNDKRGIYRSIGQASFIIVAIMLLMSALMQIFGASLMRVLYPKVEDAVMKNVLVYFRITAINYPFIALYSTLAGSMRGQGNSRTPMLVATMINVINISLNALFIYVFELGVAGAAIATMIGWICGASVMVLLTIRHNSRLIFSFANMRPKKEVLFPIFRIGLPSGLDSLLFHAGKIIVSTFLAGMGTANMSGNVIAGSMFGIFCIPGNAFAIAVTTIVGQCYGAGRRIAARKNLLKCIGIAMICLAGMSLALYWLVPTLVGFYKPTDDARPVAVEVLRLYLLMIPLLWPTAFISSNGLRAVGDVKFSTAVSMVSMWTMRVFGAWLLGVYFDMGPLGINMAMGLDWLFRSVFYLPRILFRRKLRSDVEVEQITVN